MYTLKVFNGGQCIYRILIFKEHEQASYGVYVSFNNYAIYK
jgi:hypothetical protein